ncbi:Chitinase [hydrothermal vent metagenome]|uniref:Chitinase n=1 Tax=hydrothermal vent metagenome TaxID=652676 RepID=A0A3B0YCF3_9ZZZZ
MKNILLLVALAFGLVSCGGGSSSSDVPIITPDPAPVDPVPVDPVPVDPAPVDPAPVDPFAEIQIIFDFSDSPNAWEVGFSDYPVGKEVLYELDSSFTQLPAPLENQAGINVSGANLSDDLFMFIKKRFSGFEANAQYKLQFEITFATNAPAGCVGTGGAPGESVTVKAGATVVEPLALDNGDGFYVMNIDKGAQRMSGSDAMNIGDFANTKECSDNDFSYELKTLVNIENSFSRFIGSDGALWLLFATDSGFESTTSIFFVSGKLVATRI